MYVNTNIISSLLELHLDPHRSLIFLPIPTKPKDVLQEKDSAHKRICWRFTSTLFPLAWTYAKRTWWSVLSHTAIILGEMEMNSQPIWVLTSWLKSGQAPCLVWFSSLRMTHPSPCIPLSTTSFLYNALFPTSLTPPFPISALPLPHTPASLQSQAAAHYWDPPEYGLAPLHASRKTTKLSCLRHVSRCLLAILWTYWKEKVR